MTDKPLTGHELAQVMADGINRHTSSPEFLRRRARYENPKASDEEIERIVAAEAVGK